jgi:wyosine [tRNA(Phe)-imidazoG37] synthetase (radical SAM superfamily)
MSDEPLKKLHTHHPRQWRDFDYVYPVISRRAGGLSIGINLNIDKVCNWDCVYCQVDRTTPPPRRDVDVDQLTEELTWSLRWAASGDCWLEPPFDAVPASQRRLNDLAFSGDGEPTTSDQFLPVARIATQLRQKLGDAATKIVVLSNMTMAHRPQIQEAFALLDQHNGEIWAKLEAGTAEDYKTIDRSSVPFAKIVENILLTGRVRPIVIQSLFMKLHGQPPSEGQFAAYLDQLVGLRDQGCQLKLIQLYTTARQATEAYVSPLSQDQLTSMAELAASRLSDVPIETYPGHDPTTDD